MAATAKLRDVADRAGVHPGTASRALNPATRSMVNPATVRRVLEAARALGYQPNPMARGLKTSRSLSVGMLIPDLTNPLFPPIVRGVEDVLRAAGYTALLANTDNDVEQEAAYFAALRSRQVDGFMVATALREHSLLSEAAAAGTSMVLVNRSTDDPRIPAVVADDGNGVATAVHHLAGLGHTRIAHLAGPQNTSTGSVRCRAYRQALRECGLDADPELVVECGGFVEAEGARGLRSLLERGRPFTAVLCANDLLALGCYDVMLERGLSCPDDMSLVGFNDMPFVDKLSPPLSTVRVPHYQIGAEGARMLLERIADPTLPPKSVTLPVTFVERGSTAPPARPRPAPARATS